MEIGTICHAWASFTWSAHLRWRDLDCRALNGNETEVFDRDRSGCVTGAAMRISARAGVRTVNLSKVRAAYSLGANKRQILRLVILPNALPEIFTGVRVALGVSWGTVVAAELVGTNTGLGAMIFTARNFSGLM